MKKLSISNIPNFVSWDKVKSINDFTYPWRKDAPPSTSFAAYYDDSYLHFRFVAKGPKPLVYVKDNNKLEVIQSERVEIFFREDEKMNPYYVLEMDPHGRVLDYKAKHYREFERSWSWPESLDIKTEIVEDGYTLQGKFSLSLLKEFELLRNNQIQIGLYRGHCVHLENNKGTIQWISWIDPKSPEPDFHVPTSFGTLTLD